MQKYVRNGQVDYLAWKKNDLKEFEEYLQGWSDISLKGISRDEQKAFWINAYNAFTVYATLERIPSNQLLAKSFSIQMVPGFFNKRKFKVAGRPFELAPWSGDVKVTGPTVL